MQKIFTTGRQILYILFIGSFFLLVQSCETKEKKPEADKGYVIPDTVMKTLKVDTVSISQLVTAITLTGKVGINDDNVVPVYESLKSGYEEEQKD